MQKLLFWKKISLTLISYQSPLNSYAVLISSILKGANVLQRQCIKVHDALRDPDYLHQKVNERLGQLDAFKKDGRPIFLSWTFFHLLFFKFLSLNSEHWPTHPQPILKSYLYCTPKFSVKSDYLEDEWVMIKMKLTA